MAMLSNATGSVPPSSSGIIWPLPRYGMCCILTPAIVLNSSPEMCCEVPLPAEPNEYLFGFAFSSAMNSRTLLAGTLGCTSSTLGCVAYIVIGSKLVTGSYEQLVVQRGVDRVRADRAAADRVAVGRGARQLGRADRAALAWLVLDHDRLAERGAELLANHARQDVGGAAGRERHDVADRLVGPVRAVCARRRRSGHAAPAARADALDQRRRRWLIMSPPLCGGMPHRQPTIGAHALAATNNHERRADGPTHTIDVDALARARCASWCAASAATTPKSRPSPAT